MNSLVWCVALYGAETWTLRRNEQKTTGSMLDVDMEKDGACIMDRQNKKCSCAGKSGRKNNNAGTDKEEEKELAGPLAKKELPAEECSNLLTLINLSDWSRAMCGVQRSYLKFNIFSKAEIEKKNRFTY